MSEFKVDTITNRDGSYGPQVCGITSFMSSGLTLPSGPTEFRGGRGRGVFGSGNTPSDTRNIDVIEIATTGNGVDFGDDNIDGRGEGNASFASSTRGIFAGGYSTGDGEISNIAYLTISSQGGVYDFGDLSTVRRSNAGASNNVRGLSFGGHNGTDRVNTIEFVTIATTGDSVNFGSLTEQVSNTGSGISNGTRAFQMAGYSNQVGDDSRKIHAVTIATTGDAVKFGDLITSKKFATGTSSKTRALCIGGATPTALTDIEYVTIATEGGATDFGDLLNARYSGAAASNDHGGLG